MNKRQLLWLFACGQLCFIVGVALCIALKPAGLSSNNGISYYGIFAKTFSPYFLAILGPAFFGMIVAWKITQTELRPIRLGLLAFSVLAIIIAFTPYSDGALLDWTHTIAGIFLFSLQLILSAWLVTKLQYAFWAILLAALELIAGIVAAFYVLPSHGFLIHAQVVFQLSFGALVLYSLRCLLRDKATKVSHPD